MATTYIVQTAAAKMPGNCKGRYRRVAVLEVDAGLDQVAMISERARGCVRIVATWEKRNVGRTDACAYSRALEAAEEMADRLNRDAAAPARRYGARLLRQWARLSVGSLAGAL